jgi:uncharacterized damage-inducible protein DinB
MTDKEIFLKMYAEEFAITQRVLAAAPQDKADFTPSPLIKKLGEVVWSLTCSERVWGAIAGAGIDFSNEMWKRTPPATFAEMVSIHAADHADSLAKLQALTDADWEAVTAGWSGPMPRYELAWGMLHDTIHHRGQLSTYFRAAGAVVPSIYGPTVEEPMGMTE